MSRFLNVMIAVVLVGILAALAIPRFNRAISVSNVKDVLGQIYIAQTECKTEKGFYSEWPEAGKGMVKEAMNKSGFDFEIKVTDSSFIAYAGKKVLPNDLLNSSELEFVPLYSIDQDSTFQAVPN